MNAFTFGDQAFLASTKRTFGPASFPGLWRWYRADSYTGIANDGDTVGGGFNARGTWTDFSGNADHATNPGPSGPVFKTAIIGTKPVLRMLNEYLSFAPGALNDFTLICVHQKTAANSFIVADSFVANHQLRRDFGGDNTTVFYAGAGGVSPSALGAPNNVMSMTVRRSGIAVTFRENTTARAGGNEAGAWSPLEIGSIALGGHIDMAELIIYKGVSMSNTDVDALYTNYLKPKWTTLP